MSLKTELQTAYPNLNAADIDAFTDEDMRTMLDAAAETAHEANRPAPPPPKNGVVRPSGAMATGESPLLRGHRVGHKALSCPGMPDDKRGRIIAPGEIITFRDVGNNSETWNRLVNIGRIYLDRHTPDPGRPANA